MYPILLKIGKLNDLSIDRKMAIKQVANEKLEILINGALKRGLDDDVSLYKVWKYEIENPD